MSGASPRATFDGPTALHALMLGAPLAALAAREVRPVAVGVVVEPKTVDRAEHARAVAAVFREGPLPDALEPRESGRVHDAVSIGFWS